MSKTVKIQWFSIDFLFIRKSSLRCLGQAFCSHFGRSLVSLGSLLVVCDCIEILSKIR